MHNGPISTVVHVGDCDGAGRVIVDELLALVNIALGYGDATSCTAGDVDHDRRPTIDESQTAVSSALDIRAPAFVRLVVQRRRR